MVKEDLISCDKEILGGTPVFKGTRVPIKNLIDYLEGGDSLNDFLNDFPSVTKAQTIQLLEFAKEALFEGTNASSN